MPENPPSLWETLFESGYFHIGGRVRVLIYFNGHGTPTFAAEADEQ
jgi:hypothetical protein